MVVSAPQVSQQAAKCIPAMACPELTEQIRREIAASLHQRKGDFACYFLTDLVTFTLPAGLHAHTLTHTHTQTHSDMYDIRHVCMSVVQYRTVK